MIFPPLALHVEFGSTFYTRPPTIRTTVSGKLFKQRGLALRILPVHLNLSSQPVHWLCVLIGSSVQSKIQCSGLFTVCLARTWKSIHWWQKDRANNIPMEVGVFGLGVHQMGSESWTFAGRIYWRIQSGGHLLCFSSHLRWEAPCSFLWCLMIKQVQSREAYFNQGAATMSSIGSIQEDIFLSDSTFFLL